MISRPWPFEYGQTSLFSINGTFEAVPLTLRKRERKRDREEIKRDGVKQNATNNAQRRERVIGGKNGE